MWCVCEEALLPGAGVWEFQKIVSLKGGGEQMEKSVVLSFSWKERL